jgi:hypothetical protein
VAVAVVVGAVAVTSLLLPTVSTNTLCLRTAQMNPIRIPSSPSLGASDPLLRCA